MAVALARAFAIFGGVAVLFTACGAPPAPGRKTMMAQAWTCEMISKQDALTSRFVETVSFQPAGDYRSTATVTAASPGTTATMQLEWSGRWALAGDTFRRTFETLKATSGEVNGVTLTQDLLDKAASEFRRGPVGAEAQLLSLTEREMVFATNFDPLTCRR